MGGRPHENRGKKTKKEKGNRAGKSGDVRVWGEVWEERGKMGGVGGKCKKREQREK